MTFITIDGMKRIPERATRNAPQHGRPRTRTFLHGLLITSGGEARWRESLLRGKLAPNLFEGSLYFSLVLTSAQCHMDGSQGKLFVPL